MVRGALGRIYRDGEVIISENSRGKEIYYVYMGQVDILRAGRAETLYTLDTGEFFGEMAYLLDEVRTAAAVGLGSDGKGVSPSPRKVRFLPIRFGSIQPSHPGGTGNLSETGLYVITQSPFDPGDPLNMLLRLDTDAIDLQGQVIWMTKEHRVGRPPGMGVCDTFGDVGRPEIPPEAT